MPDQPKSFVEIEEIRPCPDGSFNVVFVGAGYDLNFSANALLALGVIVPNERAEFGYGSAPGVRWRTLKGDPGRATPPEPTPQELGQAVAAEMRELFRMYQIAPADAATMWAHHGTRRIDWPVRDVAYIDEPGVRESMPARAASVDVDGNSTDDNAEVPLSADAIEEAAGIIADLAAAHSVSEVNGLIERAQFWIGGEQPAGENQGADPRHDVRPGPSTTVAFEEMYPAPWHPVIRRTDTVYHSVQWVPDSEVINGHLGYLERFVDEHSTCDFTVHHQKSTDRLIVRRHDHSIPITVDAHDYLIAEVETGQLFTVTPAEYRARFCEAP